jgi:antirestriction protein ArdC
MARAKETKEKRDLRQELAERLIQKIEEGTAFWQKPWAAGEVQRPSNAVTGKPYSGVNAANLMDFSPDTSDNRWCTYKQAESQGWQVRKGERGIPVEKWMEYEHKRTPDEIATIQSQNGGQPVDPTEKRLGAQYYTVFHASQVEGIPPIERPFVEVSGSPDPRVQSIADTMGVPVAHGGGRAFYRPSTDRIQMPTVESFAYARDHDTTLLHELSHSTGHRSRMNRTLSGGFGSPTYAKEELRAEMSAAMTAAMLGMGFNPDAQNLEEGRDDTENTSAYLASWLRALPEKERKTEMVAAIKDAQAISDYLLERAPEIQMGRAQEKVVDMEPRPTVTKAHPWNIPDDIDHVVLYPGESRSVILGDPDMPPEAITIQEISGVVAQQIARDTQTQEIRIIPDGMDREISAGPAARTRRLAAYGDEMSDAAMQLMPGDRLTLRATGEKSLSLTVDGPDGPLVIQGETDLQPWRAFHAEFATTRIQDDYVLSGTIIGMDKEPGPITASRAAIYILKEDGSQCIELLDSRKFPATAVERYRDRMIGEKVEIRGGAIPTVKVAPNEISEFTLEGRDKWVSVSRPGLEPDAVYMLMEYQSIRQSEHPGYAGLSDPVANAEAYARRFGQEHENAQRIANVIRMHPEWYSDASGLSQERVTAIANMVEKGIAQRVERLDPVVEGVPPAGAPETTPATPGGTSNKEVRHEIILSHRNDLPDYVVTEDPITPGTSALEIQHHNRQRITGILKDYSKDALFLDTSEYGRVEVVIGKIIAPNDEGQVVAFLRDAYNDQNKTVSVSISDNGKVLTLSNPDLGSVREMFDSPARPFGLMPSVPMNSKNAQEISGRLYEVHDTNLVEIEQKDSQHLLVFGNDPDKAHQIEMRSMIGNSVVIKPTENGTLHLEDVTLQNAFAAISEVRDRVPLRRIPDVVHPFMGAQQVAVTQEAMHGEEGAFFSDKMKEFQSIIQAMPQTYGTDGLDASQKPVALHYFVGSANWYIIEKDSDLDRSGQIQAFGLADIGQGYPELGYINIPEIIAAGAELDYHFTPTTLLEIQKQHYPEMLPRELREQVMAGKERAINPLQVARSDYIAFTENGVEKEALVVTVANGSLALREIQRDENGRPEFADVEVFMGFPEVRIHRHEPNAVPGIHLLPMATTGEKNALEFSLQRFDTQRLPDTALSQSLPREMSYQEKIDAAMRHYEKTYQEYDKNLSNLLGEMDRATLDVTDVNHAEQKRQFYHAYNQIGSDAFDTARQNLKEYRIPYDDVAGRPEMKAAATLLHESHKSYLEHDKQMGDRLDRGLKEHGKSAIARMSPNASPVKMATAVFWKHGIPVTENSDSLKKLVDDIQHKNLARLQSVIGHNSLNPASQEIFERMTGVQLGKTQKERANQLNEWAGPEIVARLSQQAEVKHKAMEATAPLRKLQQAFDALKYADIGTREANAREVVVNGQQWVAMSVAAGFDQVRPQKQGAAVKYVMVHETEGVTRFAKDKRVNEFGKAVMAIDGKGNIHNALEKAGLKLPDIPYAVASPESVRQRKEAQILGAAAEPNKLRKPDLADAAVMRNAPESNAGRMLPALPMDIDPVQLPGGPDDKVILSGDRSAMGTLSSISVRFKSISESRSKAVVEHAGRERTLEIAEDDLRRGIRIPDTVRPGDWGTVAIGKDQKIRFDPGLQRGKSVAEQPRKQSTLGF